MTAFTTFAKQLKQNHASNFNVYAIHVHRTASTAYICRGTIQYESIWAAFNHWWVLGSQLSLLQNSVHQSVWMSELLVLTHCLCLSHNPKVHSKSDTRFIIVERLLNSSRDLRMVFLHSNRISNRIGRPIRFRIEFSKPIGRIYQRIFNPFHRYLFCICHEREWCTQLSTCYSFQFSPKTRQTMPLYGYLTPKLDFKRKFYHHQSFLYKGRLTVRTIRKFRIGHHYESNPESEVRKFDSKSNLKASQVPT